MALRHAEEAREVIRQIGLRPLAQHDPVAISTYTQFSADIAAVAAGGPCSAAWAAEVARFRNIPLDEYAGEGWRRQATYSKHRSTAAGIARIKSAIRLKENLARAKQFILKHGQRGKSAVEYEWKNYKRILKVSTTRSSKRNLRICRDAFYKRLYRMDESVTDDWASHCEVSVVHMAMATSAETQSR